MKTAWARTICRLLVVLMVWTPYQAAQAAMIGTDQVVTSSSSADRGAVLSFINRTDVASQLQALGLDPATAKDRVAGLTERVELTQVPFFPQSEYQCGPAALATALASFGVKVTPEDLVPQVYLPERKGSLQIEMMAAARRHGMVSYQLAPRFEDVLRELSAGNPVIVLQNLGFGGGWHYAVAVGYDYSYGDLILRSGIT